MRLVCSQIDEPLSMTKSVLDQAAKKSGFDGLGVGDSVKGLGDSSLSRVHML